MINICHIISGDLWAGAEAVAYQLVKQLNKYPDVAVTTIVLNKGLLYEKLCKAGIKTWVFEERFHSFGAIFRKVRALLKEMPQHIIHSHRYKENFLAYLLKKRNPNLKLVATQHGLPEVFDSKRFLKKRLIGRINFLLLEKRFSSAIVVSRDMCEKLTSRYRFSNIEVVHNGIKIPSIFNKRKTDDRFIIGTAGRLYPVKNFSLFIDLCVKIHKKFPKVKFQIAGEGPDRKYLEGLVQTSQLMDSFMFLGHVKDMERYYSGLDLYINTSHHEGIPMSILEAMSYGIPTIAPNVGGIPEIIQDGVNGYLVNVKSSQEYSDICCELIENEKLKKYLSENSKKTIIDCFSVEAMCSSYYRIYNKIMQVVPSMYAP